MAFAVGELIVLVKVAQPEPQFIIWLIGFTIFTGIAVFWPMAKV